MGGDRQHVLPRFLLKGFSSRVEGDKYYTWVYRGRAEPFETNIINVGVSKSFYTEHNDTRADDLITSMEGEYATYLDKIRLYNSSTVLESNRVAGIASLMEIRTRHLRDSFLDSSNAFISEFTNFFRDNKKGREFLLDQFRNDPSIIKNAIDKHLKGKNVHPLIRQMLYEKGFSTIPKLLNQFDLSLLVDYFFKEALKIIPSGLKDGHLRALRKASTYNVRRERYEQLKWRVYVFEQGDLIFGDCGIIFEVDSSRRFKTFLVKADKLKAVFLPISSKHLIIGSPANANPSLEMNEINRAVAECSREFFIAGNKDYELRNLQTVISINSYMLTDDEIKSVFREVMGRSTK